MSAERCGETLPRHVQPFMHACMKAVRDSNAQIRASAISLMGTLCELLKYSLKPIVADVLNCVSDVINLERDVEVRRASMLLVNLMLRGLNKSFFEVIENPQQLIHVVSVVAENDKDDMTRGHALTALEQLDVIFAMLEEDQIPEILKIIKH